MQIKMYHDNDLFVCRFGSYKDQGGDYFVECGKRHEYRASYQAAFPDAQTIGM